MTPDRLLGARSEAEVVDLVREYLSAWRPEELRQIPERCRPGKIRDGEDIADCAFELTRARIAASDRQPLLIEMESFFGQACARLSKLDGAGAGRGEAEPTSDLEP